MGKIIGENFWSILEGFEYMSLGDESPVYAINFPDESRSLKGRQSRVAAPNRFVDRLFPNGLDCWE